MPEGRGTPQQGWGSKGASLSDPHWKGAPDPGTQCKGPVASGYFLCHLKEQQQDQYGLEGVSEEGRGRIKDSHRPVT